MPGMDGTGPQGMGPGTGRAMGFCRSWATGRAVSYRCGFGLDRGFGRGFRRFAAPWSVNGADEGTFRSDEEKHLLKLQKDMLEAKLKDIDDALKSFEDTGKDK